MKLRTRIQQEDTYTQPFYCFFLCRSDEFLSNPEAPPGETPPPKKTPPQWTDHMMMLQEEDSLYYLALQVFLQHLWNGMLQHLLISKLAKINKKTTTESCEISCTYLNIMYYIDIFHKSVCLPFQYLLCRETPPHTQSCWGDICIIQSVASILKEALMSNLPPVFETLCWGGHLFLGGWMQGRGQPNMQIRVLQP